MEDGGARPGDAFHHHQPERFAGHIDAIAQRIGAEQGSAGIIAEDIDERAGIDRIDMLGVERQAIAGEAIGDAGVDGLQPLDRREQAERAAAGGRDQPGIGRAPRLRSVTISTSAQAA